MPPLAHATGLAGPPSVNEFRGDNTPPALLFGMRVASIRLGGSNPANEAGTLAAPKRRSTHGACSDQLDRRLAGLDHHRRDLRPPCPAPDPPCGVPHPR